MKTEEQIIVEIFSLEKEIFDEEAYLDESQQSKLQTLYALLDRTLTEEEKLQVYAQRLDYIYECLGERNEDYLYKKCIMNKISCFINEFSYD